MNPLRRAGCPLAAVALVAGMTTTAAHADTATPAPDTSWIRLDNLSPAVIPAKGVITLTGTLHNGSSETWHHLSVEPATSQHALTNTAGVAYYATFDPAQVHLGSALPDRRAALADLEPGADASFRITIPRKSLGIDGNPGVYWLGVTPISDESHPESLTARTYLPLLPKVPKTTHVNVSMVVPLRENPLRLPSGQVADPAGFASLFSDAGRLGRIATFGTAAAGRALTWLVDPALLDIADQTAAGVADYGLGTAGATPPKPSAPAPSSSASPNTPSHPTHLAPDVTPAQASVIRRWSSTITSLLRTSDSYALPYGDPVISPLVSSGNRALLSRAESVSAQRMKGRKLNSHSAVAPQSGTLSAPEWNALSAEATAFVTPSESQQVSARSKSRTLVAASPASDGSPGPVDMQSALNIRQRILSEATLAAATGAKEDLTVVLPALWDPGAAAGEFFDPLTKPWISFTGLPSAASGPVTLPKTSPNPTSNQLTAISAANALSATADQIPDLLGTSDADRSTLAHQLDAAALSTVSLSAVRNPQPYIDAALRTVSTNSAILKAVRVEGTHFVTLSGSTGVITVAVRNGTNVPIRVRLQQIDAPERSSVTVSPAGPIELEPGERTTVRLDVSAPRVSVQEVTISATSPAGYAVGSDLTFTLRSSPVGAVAWAITIGVATVLVLLTVRSLRRRRKAKQEVA